MTRKEMRRYHREVYEQAKAGNPISQAAIAKAVIQKDIDFVSEEEAFALAEEAANSGCSQGKYVLSLLYRLGIGTAQDSEQGEALMDDACESMSLDAIYFRKACIKAAESLGRVWELEATLSQKNGELERAESDLMTQASSHCRSERERTAAEGVLRKDIQASKDTINKQQTEIDSLHSETDRLRKEIASLSDSSAQAKRISDLEKEKEAMHARYKDDLRAAHAEYESNLKTKETEIDNYKAHVAEADQWTLMYQREVEKLKRLIEKRDRLLRRHNIPFYEYNDGNETEFHAMSVEIT